MHAPVPSPGRDGSDDDLAAVLKRLRDEPPPSYLAAVAWGLSARVKERLAEQQRRSWLLGWSVGLGGLSLGCVVLAVTELRQASELAMADPFLAGWLLAMLH